MPILKKHKSPFSLPQSNERRNKDHDKFYDSPVWRHVRYTLAIQRRKQDERDAIRIYKLSKEARQEDLNDWWDSTITTYKGKIPAPLCEHCRRENKLGSGTTLDHIKPREQHNFRTEDLDPKNLQFLCEHHNSIKTAKQ